MSYEKEQEFLQKLADEVLDMSDDDVDPFSDIDDSDVDKNYDPSQTEYDSEVETGGPSTLKKIKKGKVFHPIISHFYLFL